MTEEKFFLLTSSKKRVIYFIAKDKLNYYDGIKKI
jgi:hypothetical protein